VSALILVDTSVWIEAFRARDYAQLAQVSALQQRGV